MNLVFRQKKHILNVLRHRISVSYCILWLYYPYIPLYVEALIFWVLCRINIVFWGLNILLRHKALWGKCPTQAGVQWCHMDMVPQCHIATVPYCYCAILLLCHIATMPYYSCSHHHCHATQDSVLCHLAPEPGVLRNTDIRLKRLNLFISSWCLSFSH